MYIIKRGSDTYVTEDERAKERLSGKSNPASIKEIALTDVVAYFTMEVPEKKVAFSKHPTFPKAYKISDELALETYINEARSMLQLDPFDPDRVEWEQKRIDNLKGLEKLFAKKNN